MRHPPHAQMDTEIAAPIKTSSTGWLCVCHSSRESTSWKELSPAHVCHANNVGRRRSSMVHSGKAKELDQA